MAPNPCGCCGMPLQAATKLVASVDMVLTTIAAAWSLYELCGLRFPGETFDRKQAALFITPVAWSFSVRVGQFALGLILLQGANQKNISRCRLWFAATMVIFGLSLARFMYTTWMMKRDLELATIATSALAPAYYAYILWVVRAFIDEVELESKPEPNPEQKLTRAVPVPPSPEIVTTI